MIRAALAVVCLSALGCGKAAEPVPDTAPARPVQVAPPAASRPLPVATRQPAPVGRLVAIGDLHGDLAATRRALRLAGAIDARDRWVGGALVVVQVGDQLDRGDDEREILELLERLADEAHAAGGAVHVLLGNHETMNVRGDFRYVTPGGWADFGASESDRVGRAEAFRPGGPWARVLARHPIALVVGDTVFAHGGVLPSHVAYGLERLNREVRAWLLGQGPRPAPLDAPDSPVWSRHYSVDTDAAACEALAATLAGLGARRLVVAHTPQKGGITSACDGRVWRVDVGLAAHYGGPTEVLEIAGERVRALRE